MLVGKMFFRLSVLSGADPVDLPDALVTVELLTLVPRLMDAGGELIEGVVTVDASAVMEADGEPAEGVGIVDAASVMEKNCGSDTV